MRTAQVDQQGPDRGTQYRSGIFTLSPEQEQIAKKVTEEVQEKHFTPKGQKIATKIEPAGKWWDAEDYHQECESWISRSRAEASAFGAEARRAVRGWSADFFF